jgi:hypothetical protein
MHPELMAAASLRLEAQSARAASATSALAHGVIATSDHLPRRACWLACRSEVDALHGKSLSIRCERQLDGASRGRRSADHVRDIHLLHRSLRELHGEAAHGVGATSKHEQSTCLPVQAVWQTELVDILAARSQQLLEPLACRIFDVPRVFRWQKRWFVNDGNCLIEVEESEQASSLRVLISGRVARGVCMG